MSASGPLVARWRTLEHGPVEAGALGEATVEVENAGSATWRTRGPDEGLFLCYHWLDPRGNPIVFDSCNTYHSVWELLSDPESSRQRVTVESR